MKFKKGDTVKFTNNQLGSDAENGIARIIGFEPNGNALLEFKEYDKAKHNGLGRGFKCKKSWGFYWYVQEREMKLNKKGDNKMNTKKELLSLFEWFVKNKSKLNDKALEILDNAFLEGALDMEDTQSLVNILIEFKETITTGLPITVDEHKVKFDKDNITVGCTTVSLGKLEEIVKRAKKLKRGGK